MKNNKIIALGLALGLIFSTVTPAIADKAFSTSKEVGVEESNRPIDLGRFKNINMDDSTSKSGQEQQRIISGSKTASCTNEDYEEMIRGGMTVDEITDVLQEVEILGVDVKSMISQVKQQNSEKKGVGYKELKDKLKKHALEKGVDINSIVENEKIEKAKQLSKKMKETKEEYLAEFEKMSKKDREAKIKEMKDEIEKIKKDYIDRINNEKESSVITDMEEPISPEEALKSKQKSN